MLHRVVKTCRVHQERVQIRTVAGRSPGWAVFTHQQMSHCEHFMLVHGRLAAVSRLVLLLFVNDGDIAKRCEAPKLFVPRVSFVNLTLTLNHEYSCHWVCVKDERIIHPDDDTECWESTATAASWPRPRTMTPGHCQHRSVTPIIVTT